MSRSSLYRKSFCVRCLCFRQNRLRATSRDWANVVLFRFIQAGMLRCSQRGQINVGAQGWTGPATEPEGGHELFSPPASAEMRVGWRAARREGVMSCPIPRQYLLFVPCERAERPAGQFVWKSCSIQSWPVCSRSRQDEHRRDGI